MYINETFLDEWLQGPALDAPPGATTDFVNPPSLQKYDVLCQSICLAVTTLLILVRVYTKFRILKSPGWDDCELLALQSSSRR